MSVVDLFTKSSVTLKPLPAISPGPLAVSSSGSVVTAVTSRPLASGLGWSTGTGGSVEMSSARSSVIPGGGGVPTVTPGGVTLSPFDVSEAGLEHPVSAAITSSADTPTIRGAEADL